MRKQCIVHIGMHKTGSTTIQNTLHDANIDNCQYLNLWSPNHSGFFVTVFSSNAYKYHGHTKLARTHDEIDILRDNFNARLESEIRSCTKDKAIISGEDISNIPEEDLVTLREYLKTHFREVKIIGYVRPPVSFIQSAFQQLVKDGLNYFNPDILVPSYRSKFEKFDRVFGESNVRLVLYSRESLKDGDIVSDFCHQIGIPRIIREDISRNESLSMEATALLYLQRKYGSGYGNYKNSPRDNDVFITELSRIEGRKFSFGHNIVKRVMEQIKGDIDWISDRLSLDILEKDDKSNDGVDSEDELIDIAFNARKKLIDILILERATQNCDLEKLCDILDTFKKNISTPEAHLPLETVLFGGGHTSEIAKEIKSIESAVDVDILRVLTERLLAVGEREAALIVIQCALKLRPNGPRLKEIYSTLVNPC